MKHASIAPTLATLTLATAAIGLVVGSGSVNSVTATVDPSVITLAMIGGLPDGNGAHTCTPATPPAPPTPGTWWRSLPVTQPPRKTGVGIAGFDIWRNQQDSCEEFRKDLYRSAVRYDLSSLAASKGLIQKATLSFTAVLLPVPRQNSLCQAFTGGGLNFLRLPNGTALPSGDFAEIVDPFPVGARQFAIPQPWFAGTLPGGATTSASGSGGATFDVDVTAHVNDVLNNGQTLLMFSLTGSDETPPTVAPPDRFDCRTAYQFSALTVTHL